MASSLISSCRFNPTLGGTTDWTYSSAVTGYNSPVLAGAVNAAVYSYRAESTDLSQWEEGTGAYNSGTGVFARTTVLYNSSGTGTASGQSGAGTKISFSAVPQVAVVALAEDLLLFNASMSLTTAQKAQAQTNIFVATPTTQLLTSGTTYTPTTTNVKWIEVYIVGAGGGGAGGGGSGGTGGTGGTSTFNSVNAVGGSGGAGNGGLTGGGQGGAGGTAGTGTASWRYPGQAGMPGGTGVAGIVNGTPGNGGYSFGAARGGTGGAIGGAGNGGPAGGGGGETAYLTLVYAASYTYAIGAAGTGGTAGSSGGAGNAGAAGRILVVEHYS